MTAVIPASERLFACEYVQLHGVEDQGPSDAGSSSSQSARTFLGEGPVVLGRMQGVPVIQIGMPENMMTWQLTPELPCLKASATAFMFAVPYSQQFYILEFMPEYPSAQLAVLEALLQQFCSYAVSQEVPQASAIKDGERVASEDGTTFTTDPTLAKYIRTTGEFTASAVNTAGDYLSKGIVQAGEWYRARYPERQEDVKMSATTMSGIGTAKRTTETVAKYTTAAAGAIGSMVGHVANRATSHLKSSGKAEEGSSMRKAARVGKAGVVAVVEVFDAMHDAGRKVLSSGTTETATCVQYRYGDEAAEAAQQSMGMAVDAYDVYGAYKNTRSKALAKAFAKGAIVNPAKAQETAAAEAAAAKASLDMGAQEPGAAVQPEAQVVAPAPEPSAPAPVGAPGVESIYPPAPAPP